MYFVLCVPRRFPELRYQHGHKDYPPNAGDFLELPAGGKINAEISCDKGATSWYPTSQG